MADLKIVSLIVFTNILILIHIQTKETDLDTLKLLHVIFRHGDRSLDIQDAAFNPNINVSFSKDLLTKKGKENCYLLGKWLQNRYATFLGFYSNDLVRTANTFFERTRISLQLVLEGLFSYKTSSETSTLENNQIQFKYTNLPTNNTLLVVPNPSCTNYFTYYNNYTNSESYRNMIKKYTNLNEYLKVQLNITLTSLTDFVILYDTLCIQNEIGISLPSWADFLIPKIESSVMDQFLAITATKELKNILIGGFVQNLIKTSTLKFKNQLQPKTRKLFLYSGHDLNVYCTLQLFKYDFKTRPPYNSCVMIEAHTIDNVDGFKVFYKNGLNEKVVSVTIPDCGLFCPLATFTKLYEGYFSHFNTC